MIPTSSKRLQENRTETLFLLMKPNLTMIDQAKQRLIYEMVDLIGYADYWYKDLPATQLCTQIVPPIILDQYKIIRENDRLVAFATYAKMSPSVVDKWLLDKKKLALEDWQSGKELWFMDAVAPLGHGTEIARLLISYLAKEAGYKGQKLRFRRNYGRNRRDSYVLL